MSAETLTGPQAIRAVFEATLAAKEPLLRTVLAGEPLVYLAGDDFAEEYMAKRNARGIHLRSLRFDDERVDRPAHTDYTNFDKEVRIAPAELRPAISLVMWDDNTVIVKTDPEIEVLWHHDIAFAETMKRWYDFIWRQSR